MSPPQDDDQRAYPRVPVNREFATVEAFLDQYVINISKGGVFIRSHNLLPIGTLVQLKFSILVEDFEVLEGEGEVVRVVEDDEHRGMGVRFTHLTPDSERLIERLMELRDA